MTPYEELEAEQKAAWVASGNPGDPPGFGPREAYNFMSDAEYERLRVEHDAHVARYNKSITDSRARYAANPITQEKLDKIVVLWREHHGPMGLWGIPYGMRKDCDQSPRHLWEASHRVRDKGFLPPDLSGWVWLGSPGWWGDIPNDGRWLIEKFLAKFHDLVPNWPGEWIDLSEWVSPALR